MDYFSKIKQMAGSFTRKIRFNTSEDKVKKEDFEYLPTFIAIPLMEYFEESNKVLRLHRLCDLFEIFTRFMTILGYAKIFVLFGKDQIPRTLQNIIANNIEQPTFSQWRDILKAIESTINKLNRETEFSPLISSYLNLVNLLLFEVGTHKRDQPEDKILPLRNFIVHAGYISEEVADRFLQIFENRLLGFWKEVNISFLYKSKVVFYNRDNSIKLNGRYASKISPDELKSIASQTKFSEQFENHVLLIYDYEIIDLWPICFYGLASSDNPIFEIRSDLNVPMVYYRSDLSFSNESLKYVTVGSELPFVENKESKIIDSFLRLFHIRDQKLKKHEKFKGFAGEMQKDASELIGRSTELDKVISTVEKKNQGVIWIKGVGGIGKSIFIAKVFSLLQNMSKFIVFPYKFKIDDQRCSRYFFLTIFVSKMYSVISNKTNEPSTDLNGLEQQFFHLLRTFSKKERFEKKLVILIDGIDEINRRDRNFIREIINENYSNVIWLCIGRPEEGVDEKFRTKRNITQIFEDGLPPMSEKDIRAMFLELTGRLKYELIKRDIKELKENPFVKEVTKKADGLPLYVHYVINDILDGNITYSDEIYLPEGLQNYYFNMINRYGIGDLQNIFIPLVLTLSWTEEPLSKPTLFHFLTRPNVLEKSHEGELLLAKALQEIQTLIRRSPIPLFEGIKEKEVFGYSIYHETLASYLKSSEHLNMVNNFVLLAYCRKMLDLDLLEDETTRSFIIRHATYYLLLLREQCLDSRLEKKEIIELVNNASRCFIEMSKNHKSSLDIHLEEIIPLVEWLSEIEEYDNLFNFTLELVGILEILFKWPMVKKLANIGLNAEKNQNNPRVRLKLSFALSKMHYHRSEYKKSIEDAELLISLAQENEDLLLETELKAHIGQIQRFLGEEKEALRYTKEAEQLASKSKDLNMIGKCLYNLGIIELGRGNFEKGKDYLLQSIKQVTKIEVPKNLGQWRFYAINSLGKAEYYQKNYSKAREYFTRYKDIAEEEKSNHYRIMAEAHLSLLEPDMDIDKQIEIWEENLNAYRDAESTCSTATACGQLAEKHILKGNMEVAKNLCLEGRELISHMDNLHSKSVRNYLNGLIEITDRNQDEAVRFFELSENSFKTWFSPFQFFVKDTLNRLNLN